MGYKVLCSQAESVSVEINDMVLLELLANVFTEIEP